MYQISDKFFMIRNYICCCFFLLIFHKYTVL